MDSKKYNNTKLVIGITKGIISFLLLLLFVSAGWSRDLSNFIQNLVNSEYYVFILFVLTTGLAGSLIFFPVNFYTVYILEHKYKLSNQTVGRYFIENLKSLAVGLVIGIPVLILFYFVIISFEQDWWIIFAAAMFLISVILSQLFPILILPLFYKLSAIENTELKERISRLAEEAGIKVENVYTFDMSKNTKKANAAFTGLGKTKKIILGDTLLNNYSVDEIETVVAHELGHFKHNHIIKNLIFGTISSFLTFFIIALLYKNSISWFGFNSITEIAAMPLLALWSMLIGLLQAPLGNLLSRKYEYEADRYAVLTTSKPESFISTLERLTEQNLGDRNPHPFVEWYFYSHPSIKKRIDAIIDFWKNEKPDEKIIKSQASI